MGTTMQETPQTDGQLEILNKLELKKALSARLEQRDIHTQKSMLLVSVWVENK